MCKCKLDQEIMNECILLFNEYIQRTFKYKETELGDIDALLESGWMKGD